MKILTIIISLSQNTPLMINNIIIALLRKKGSNYILYVLFLSGYFLSCQTNDQTINCESIQTNLNVEKGRMLEIPVKSLQYDHYYKNILQIDGSWIYFGLDKGRNAIDIFNISQQKYLKSLEYRRDGSPGSLQISDFFPVSMDSIILFSEQEYKLIITDIAQSYNTEYLLHSDKIEKLHDSGTIQGIESKVARLYYDRINQYVLFPVIPGKNFDEEGFYNQKYILVYNLSTSTFSTLAGLWPENYKENNKTPYSREGWFFFFPSTIKNTVNLSFIGSNQVYTLNYLTNEVVESAIICSNYKHSFHSFHGDFNNRRDIDKFFIENGRFEQPYFDEKEELYYFPVFHDQEYKNKDGELNSMFDAPWSIIQTSKNFEVKGEFQFEGASYYPLSIAVFQNHLLVSKENPVSKENQEDLLQYQQFEIK